MNYRLACSLGATLTLSIIGSRADACTPPLACAGTEVFPLGETIPSNATGLEWWWASWERMTPDTAPLRLERYDEGAMTWQQVEHDVVGDGARERVLLRPRAPLVASTRYRLSTGMLCPLSPGAPSREFRTAATASPLPTTLGTLQATSPESANIQHGGFQGGICAYSANATVAMVTVNLAAEAMPWSAMLVYEARVDGTPYVGQVAFGSPLTRPQPGATHHGRGRALLATVCGPSTNPLHAGHPVDRTQGLSEGDHTVVFRARIAGTDTVVETAPVTVTLRCPSVPLSDAGPQGDATAVMNDATAVMNDATSGQVDGSTTRSDATAALVDAGAAVSDAPTVTHDVSGAGDVADASAQPPRMGGGCATARPSRGGAGALAALTLSLWRGRRRRLKR